MKLHDLFEISDFKRRELEYELRHEEPNRHPKKATDQAKIRDAKKRYSKAVGVMKGNTDEGIEEAEGDKCEICNGRGKIDYHSEDGPSKCQKCNGKGVQAWKPEPVNWGKVKEDDLRKRAGIEVNESNGTPLKDIFPNLDTNKDKYKGHLLQAIGSHVRNNFPDGGRGEWRKLLTSLLTMRSSEGFGRIYPHHFTMLDKAVDSLEAEIKRRPEIEKQKAKDRAEREKKHRERIKAEIKRRRREGEMTEVADESFDPAGEPSHSDTEFERLYTAYENGGERELAEYLGMSDMELDQEMTEFAMERGLHMDDDRDTVIQGYIEQVIDNAEHKDHGGEEAMAQYEAKDITDLKRRAGII